MLSAVIVGINWLYDEYTQNKLVNDYTMYNMAVRKYYENSEKFKNSGATQPLNLAKVQKIGLLPKSKNISRIAHYPFSMHVFSNRLYSNIRKIDNTQCYALIRAINSKKIQNKMAYLANQNDTRLFTAAFENMTAVDNFCSISTNISVVEYLKQ